MRIETDRLNMIWHGQLYRTRSCHTYSTCDKRSLKDYTESVVWLIQTQPQSKSCDQDFPRFRWMAHSLAGSIYSIYRTDLTTAGQDCVLQLFIDPKSVDIGYLKRTEPKWP